MTINAKFWILLALLEVAFGLVVFTLTRSYYIDRSSVAEPARSAATTSRPALVWPDSATGTAPVPASAPAMVDPGFSDPAELSRQADAYFANRQYDTAAEMYERLLVFDPNRVDTYNNLGLTLHYLGRSTEALAKLNDGIALEPDHQRIWLTLGFVNTQLGKVEQARVALARAQAGNDITIRDSATRMLNELP